MTQWREADDSDARPFHCSCANGTPTRLTSREIQERFIAPFTGGNAIDRFSFSRALRMMAFERTPPSSPRLNPETMETLTRVMERAARRGNHSDELHDVLCRAAGEARERGIRAEQLLVIMKEMWHTLPALQQLGDTERQTQLLQELISHCIQQYYEGQK